MKIVVLAELNRVAGDVPVESLETQLFLETFSRQFVFLTTSFRFRIMFRSIGANVPDRFEFGEAYFLSHLSYDSEVGLRFYAEDTCEDISG